MTARILVVEDEALVALSIAAVLKASGHSVVGTAASMADAIAAAETHRPDVALMDIRLNGPGDGIEAARVLQERLGVRVVYLTAQTDPGTRARAEATGPRGYLSKPFTPGDLLKAIDGALAG